ncbi:MAG: 4-alpha-glucanotransferase [Actinomycetota bacterium]
MIESTYTDAYGRRHRVPETTLSALRRAMGRPSGAGPLVIRPGQTPEVEEGELTREDGTRIEVAGRLPADLPCGYHTLEGASGRRRVIVSPGRCFFPSDLRIWGWSAQLYAGRSRLSWGMGDLADLRSLADWAGRQGAGMILVNPLTAVAPGYPQQASPYFPASRRFLNPIYLRVEEIPGAGRAADAVAEAARAGRRLNSSTRIDRDEVWRLKSSALEAIWAGGPPDPELTGWLDSQGSHLEEFAAWCVLAEEHGGDWTRWPRKLARPKEGVEHVRSTAPDRLRYHAWLQWLCRRQLEEAASPLMLMQDLPIGVDPGGADAWVWQDLMARDVSIGAPPDEFNTRGQNWGLPPFLPHLLRAADYEPFVQTIRAGLVSGGGLRIDHVMGLWRQFWIPSGASAAEGAYVRFPFREMLDILALESVRAGAVVVGEDLGTVEPGVREELAERRMLSYRVLWFEDDPDSWPEMSMASVTTHDLPTVAGLWSGADLQEQVDLELAPNVEATRQIRARISALTGLGEDASPEEVVAAIHRTLARAPSVLRCATLDDLAVASRRPNIPGADEGRPNWSLGLPQPLEDLMRDPLARELARIFNEGRD